MSIDSNYFNKNYYFNICLGSEEFKKSGGRKLNPRVKEMLDKIDINKNSNVLEIGCGRGDSTLYLAKRSNSIVGIDYSNDAIKIANKIKKRFSKSIQSKVSFKIMRADKLKFKNSSFDAVLIIDTLDHLSKEEVNKTMAEVNRVLKSEGNLFIKTCSNKTFLDFTYKYYIYPLNKLLTYADKKVKRTEYTSLPKDPRNDDQKLQHINEPTYNYLKNTLNEFAFKGTIYSEIGAMTKTKGIRSLIYNFFVNFYPISKFYPLNTLFSISFFGNFKKHYE